MGRICFKAFTKPLGESSTQKPNTLQKSSMDEQVVQEDQPLEMKFGGATDDSNRIVA
jgi:hypothetical protein